MQQTHQNFSPQKQGRGGRISSPRLRETIQQSEDFAGLEEGVGRYDLMLLVKRAGKSAGFSSRMIELLDYYMAFTNDFDWEEGATPIVYKSLTSTAMDLGVTERQIRKIEKQLFEVGAITWNDSGNHKRYGQRDPETKRLLYAFGVDLTPLAYLKAELQAKLHEKQLYDEAWKETKRQISWYRRQIQALLSEMIALEEEGRGEFDAELLNFNAEYEAIALRIRAGLELKTLREWLGKHKALHDSVLSHLSGASEDQKIQKRVDNESSEPQITSKSSPKEDSNDPHYKYTNQGSFNKLNTRSSSRNGFQESSSRVSVDETDVSEREEGSVEPKRIEQSSEAPKHPAIQAGLEQITSKQLLNAASERLRDHIPMRKGPMSMDDIVEAAYTLRSDLHISQKSWGRACHHLTRYGAAVCVLLLDQGTIREENRVMKPAAYFNAMINRALSGDLHLQKSVMGLLKREEEQIDPANVNGAEYVDKKATML